MSLPLEGVRVIANTYTWAGPYAVMTLADMGAEVILMESTQRWQWNTRGFIARPTKQMVMGMGPMGAAYPDADPAPRAWNRHSMFNSHARNKTSFTVDLVKPEGVEMLKRLAAVSDVVVENSTPGVMDKLGAGYADLRRVKPDIIMVSSSGMGAVGPYAGHRGFGSQMEDLSGFTWIRGYPGRDPSETPLSNHSDAAGGASIAFAVLAALRYRDRTGKGQWVDMSQSENLIGQVPDVVMDYTMNGRVQGTLGVRHPWMAPHGVYPALNPVEGAKEPWWIAIACETDEQWRALRHAMGDPAWARDARFETGLGRWKHQDELDEGIAKWTKRHLPRETAYMLQSLGVPAGAVLNDAEFSADPHLWARRFFEMISSAEAGSHWHIARYWQFSDAPIEIRKPPVRLGEHNAYVYKEVLGYSDADYEAFVERGHIGMDFAKHVV